MEIEHLIEMWRERLRDLLAQLELEADDLTRASLRGKIRECEESILALESE